MPRFLRLLICALAGIALAALIAYVQVAREQPDRVAGAPIGNNFENLVDQNGAPVTAEAFAGKYQLVFFGFTHCPAICPAELARLTNILKTLDAPARAKLAVVFVSLDPARDTPKVLKAYLSAFDPAITALTGSEAAIRATLKAWKVYAAKVPLEGGEYTVDHSTFLYFRDPRGRLLALFEPSDTPEAIAGAVQAAAGS